MSTKSASWAKWPSKWLKTLPNAALAKREAGFLDLETGTLSPIDAAGLEGSKPAPGAILRFEDFVERPLRSISQRQGDVSRGRLTGETDGGSGGDDGSRASEAQP